MASWKPKLSKRKHKFARSCQQTIPVEQILPGGIFKLNGEYSMTGQFTDINYQAAASEDVQYMFGSYQEMLKATDNDTRTAITLVNRRTDEMVFRDNFMIAMKNDEHDTYRQELNKVNLKRATEGNNNIVQEKYITVTTRRKNMADVKNWCNRMDSTFQSNFGKMGSEFTRLSTRERLRFLHDFYRPGRSSEFNNVDIDLIERKKHSFKDSICPDSMEFRRSHFKIGGRYGRVLFLREYPAEIEDTMITQIMSLPKELMLTIDLTSKSKEDALKHMSNKLVAVNTDIAKYSKKSSDMGDWNANVPLPLQEKREGITNNIKLIKEYDQRIVFTQIVLFHMADTIQELDQDTDTIISIGQQSMCQFGIFEHRQEKGLNTVLPFGGRYVYAMRTLTTENAAMFMPFVTKEIWDRGGICYGINGISHNVVVADKRLLVNGNAFILGVPGSGKSFAAKYEIANVFLSTDDDILILDPEREFGPLIKMFGGEFIHLSAGSPMHINALDMMQHCESDDDPKSMKREFVLTLLETALGKANIGPKQESIIDRCMDPLLLAAEKTGAAATLTDLYNLLKKQPEDEAQDLAVALELYVLGSLNSFAHQTNVDIHNRLVCYDIRDLGSKSKPLAMLIVLDAIQNRVALNRARGKRTWVYCDEIWMMYRNDFTAEFFDSLWRRIRKYGALGVGITQNVTSLLRSEYGCDMLANSEFVLMFNQAAKDKEALAELFNISEAQQGYIENAPSGQGLMRRSSVLIPFDGSFDGSTKLYKAMTTKIEEVSELG